MRQTGERWLSQFMDYLAGERGYSKHTISAYEADMDQFKEVLAKDLLDASTDDVRTFVLGILESGLSPKSARRKLSVVRGFYQFVFCEGGLPNDPSRHLHGPKAFKTIIRPITRGEVDQTLGFLGTDRVQDIRDRALVYTLYGSGLRVGELVRLQIADINFAQRVAKVRRGKGQKDRTAPMNQSEMEAIRLYLVRRETPRLCRGGSKSLTDTGVHRRNSRT
jgi:site-specific recombinase XerD